LSVSRPELLGGFTVGGDELMVEAAELPADGLAGGMEGRRWRDLGPQGLTMRMLGQDSGGSQRLHSFSLPVSGGFGFDLLDQAAHESPPLLLGQMPPVRERIEDQGLPSGVLEAAEVFPAATGGVLPSPVEPVAFQGFALG
jgi:hypothetical protein